ncbi:MAG: DUF2914 domain-containing protein [Bdellovibrionaceae bacterium]|nr:DUF2914 domain-containing protein [Pseudobdellovibrionaceae bacterium]
MNSWKERLTAYYEKHELKADIGFFLGGFLVDVFTLADIDDPFSIAQQVIYLTLVGAILHYDFLQARGLLKIPERWSRAWNFRHLALHFLLGSLLSIYSLFFLKSSSFFSSIGFVLILMGLMIANEMKSMQKHADIKIGLYVICVFSFFSMLFPVLLGFVGRLPFTLSVATTLLMIYGAYRLLLRRIHDAPSLRRHLVAPGGAVMGLFLLFYLIGWIPPVPLSVQNMGIYHHIEKIDGNYVLSHEKPSWKFWQNGDQDFYAEPGDKIYFFARIFSPGRFDDSVILHWSYKDPRAGWKSTDRVAMRVTGGRRNGYRGFSVKQNYAPGSWRVSVETTDAREIGRLYFNVIPVPEADPQRRFEESIQ